MDSIAINGEDQSTEELLLPPSEPPLSLLSLLAHVASEKLKTDPDFKQAQPVTTESKLTKPTEGRTITLLQASSLSENSLIKHFTSSQANEIKKKFYFTCHMVSPCNHITQSFGSEDKACTEMKRHLQRHLRNLLQAHNSVSSQEKFILYTVEKMKFRSFPENNSKKRQISKNHSRSRGILSMNEKENSENSSQSLSVMKAISPKSMEASFDRDTQQMLKVIRPNSFSNGIPDSLSKNPVGKQVDTKSKFDLSDQKLTKDSQFKTMEKSQDHNEDIKMETEQIEDNSFEQVKPVLKKKAVLKKLPCEIVSHDHGYFGSYSYKVPKDESLDDIPSVLDGERKMSILERELLKPCRVSNTVPSSSTSEKLKLEPASEEETLLIQHMNQELDGVTIAQDAWSNGTPLPLVGSEVEFLPNDSPNLKTNGALSSVFPSVNEVSALKQSKGKAKFIGQSKVEKERALKLIEEMKQQPMVEELECRICEPPRFFTAPSTLLSHYKSHAGIRPYICNICNSVFTRQHSLNYHMLIHSNQTRFTCDDCGRKFRHPSHFKEHRRRHTGESPFQCIDCGTRFKTRNTYKRHLRTRHYKLLTTQGTILNLQSTSPTASSDSSPSPDTSTTSPNQKNGDFIATQKKKEFPEDRRAFEDSDLPSHDEILSNINTVQASLIKVTQFSDYEASIDCGKSTPEYFNVQKDSEILISERGNFSAEIELPLISTKVPNMIRSNSKNEASCNVVSSTLTESCSDVLQETQSSFTDTDSILPLDFVSLSTNSNIENADNNQPNVTLYASDSNASVVFTCPRNDYPVQDSTSLTESDESNEIKDDALKNGKLSSLLAGSSSKDTWGDLVKEVLSLSSAVQTKIGPSPLANKS